MSMTESKICLGTVQFGLNYGIANKYGKPSYEQTKQIIKKAFENGIYFFDTAAAYGDSEEVIGRAFEELEIKDKVKVITKIPKMGNSYSEENAKNFIESIIRESFRKLKVNSLEAVLFHYEGDYIYFDILRKISETYPIGKLGFSIDSKEYIEEIMNKTDFNIIQLPYNILDNRFNSFLIKCREKGISIFTRSIFLQGLLLMPEEEIKHELRTVIPIIKKLKQIAKSLNMTIIEFLVSYVLSNMAITKIVVGVDNVSQLEKNINLISKLSPLENKILQKIKKIVPPLSENIVRPSKWHQTMDS